MKVTVIIGTQSRKATYLAVQEFEKSLKRYGDIDLEYVVLSDYRLDFCKGCKQCFFKGEEYCPSKDDRDTLIRKMEQSDGVVFATPTYAGQVTGRMKNFIDRLSFILHRPRFFGKAYTVIVTQGLPIGSDTLKYLTMLGSGLGFHVSKGCCITTLDPMTEKQRKKLSEEIEKTAARFHKELERPAPPPSFFWLMMFRMGRTAVMTSLNGKYRDYQYYKEKGWFESDYYYPVSLGIMKKLAGRFSDIIARHIIRHQ